jgi:hypothetical protein
MNTFVSAPQIASVCGPFQAGAALRQLRKEGFEVRDEDVARLSPLGHEHINLLGRYAFSLPEKIARGELRPLRNLPVTRRPESALTW